MSKVELEVFDKLYDRLESCITSADITGGCFASGIISSKERDIVQDTFVSFEKNAALLGAIRRSMVINPDTFNKLIDILNKEPKYNSLVEELRGQVEKLRTEARDSVSHAPGESQAPLAPPAADVPQGVRQYAEYLRSVYNRKPCGDQWSPVVSKCYIKLLTVENIEDFPQEAEEICTWAMIHSKIEVVKLFRRSIEIGQVGMLANGERASCIIVEGIPGIGKSTFSWHLGICWAKKEILHGYHLVVLLRLRDERVQRAKCVSDLFYHHDQTTQQSVVQWITSLEGDGVMMVLDGYDELFSHLQTASIFADIIKGEVLPNMTVLVSTRSSANENLHQLCHSQKCQYIEVIGFGKEEIQQYVDGALEHNKELRDQLTSYLEHHPHIHGLMYVPLNCAIVAQVFRDQMKNKSQPPQTHTEVYQLLVKTVLKRHEEKSMKPPAAKRPKKPSSGFPWLGNVSEETISQLLVLAKLAYDGTKEDRLIFHEIGGALETLGLLQEVPEQYLESSGSLYHFIHKTVQEFMAALYVSSLPPEERDEFVITFLDGEYNIAMAVRFLAGLTKLQSQDEGEQSILHVALHEVGGRMLVESLHWLFEAHDPDLIQRCMARDREWKLELSNKTNLDMFDCYVVGYCIANSKQPWSLELEAGCFMNAECMKMLTVVEKGRAFDYIHSIELLGKNEFQEELVDQGAIFLVPMLRENKVLTSLGLVNCGLGTEELCEVCSAVGMNTTLTSLDLSANMFDNKSIASLGTMLRENKVLTILGLQFCELDPKGLCEVFSAVEMNTTLTSLDLSGNTIDDQSITSLVKMLKENKVLVSLELCGCGLDPKELCEVFSAVDTTMTSLDLSENKFDDHSTTSLGKVLQQSKMFTSLRLRECGLSPEGLCAVCSTAEMNMSTLTSIDLSKNKFDKQSIASLGRMLRKSKVLKSLGLMDCGIGPEGLSEVCSAIGMNATLTSLDLSKNMLCDPSITSVVTMLREINALTSLKLKFCELCSNGISEVCNAVRVNTTLTSIVLSLNTVDEQILAYLNTMLTMLRESKGLTSFELELCESGPDGLCEVCCANGKKSSLASLHLSGNSHVVNFERQLTSNLMPNHDSTSGDDLADKDLDYNLWVRDSHNYCFVFGKQTITVKYSRMH